HSYIYSEKPDAQYSTLSLHDALPISLVDIVETGNQAGNGRLARTGTTDQRNGFTRRDGQADITQRRHFAAWIGKGDVTEFQVAFSALDHACTFIFFLFGIEDAEQRLTGCHPALELGVDVSQRFQRTHQRNHG